MASLNRPPGLIVRAQPADCARRFLGGAGGVQCHQPRDDFGGREARLPAIGRRDRRIEPAMELEDDRGTRPPRCVSLRRGQRGVATQFLDQIIQPGQGDVGLLGLGVLPSRLREGLGVGSSEGWS